MARYQSSLTGISSHHRGLFPRVFLVEMRRASRLRRNLVDVGTVAVRRGRNQCRHGKTIATAGQANGQICACVAPLRPLVGRFTYRLGNISRTLTTQIPLTESTKSQPPESTGAPESAEVFESIPQYAYPMCRYIDLEGIGVDDGFGYTVTITGPPAAKRRFLSSKTPDAHHSDLEMGKDGDGAQTLQIETTNAYSVNETYRELRPEQKARRQATAEDADGIDQACQNLSAWGLLDRTASGSTDKPDPGGEVEQRPRS